MSYGLTLRSPFVPTSIVHYFLISCPLIRIQSSSCIETAKFRVESMLKAIENAERMTEFDEALFKELVESITITVDRKAEIKFKCGVITAEQLE